jgi:energy-coupling factor transporter ATP-binding protein EcfA2
MRLKKVKYSEYENTSQEWRLDGLSLSEANLIVGKNASGKSRVLNIINGLARNLAGIDPARFSGTYDVDFIEDNKTICYQLKFKEGQVIEEIFSVESKVLLERGEGGKGEIVAVRLGREKIQFQTPTNKLAAVARRDSIQHPFLESLYSWGSSMRIYYFGTPLGKGRLSIATLGEVSEVNELDPDIVVPLYRHAEQKFPGVFSQILIRDLQQLDYNIENVGVDNLVSIPDPALHNVVGLYLKEKDLPGITDQHSMSQGMFRALSILIHVNYSQMTGKSSVILIDDIGEGLDFDRSCRLIDLLRDKAKNSHIQIILSTNDRFVMNRVPIEEWSVLNRQGNFVHVLNYGNSKALFDEFKFTGLSNFSFLEMDLANGSPPEEIGEHE